MEISHFHIKQKSFSPRKVIFICYVQVQLKVESPFCPQIDLQFEFIELHFYRDVVVYKESYNLR